MHLRCIIDEAMNPDAKLETEGEDCSLAHIPDNLAPHVYHPVVALRNALQVILLVLIVCFNADVYFSIGVLSTFP